MGYLTNVSVLSIVSMAHEQRYKHRGKYGQLQGCTLETCCVPEYSTLEKWEAFLTEDGLKVQED